MLVGELIPEITDQLDQICVVTVQILKASANQVIPNLCEPSRSEVFVIFVLNYS